MIFPNPDQPRQVFDPKSLEELAATMKEVGQAQAITVRPRGQGFEIISGECQCKLYPKPAIHNPRSIKCLAA